MSLTERINDDLKNAMKTKNEGALRALRGIKSALLLAKTEKGGADEIGEEQELKILQKLAKQRRESLEIYKAQNRPDLAQGEEQELGIIESYLPKQMSEEEVRSAIRSVIIETGATGAADLGKVMQASMKKLSGRADGKQISAIAKELLGS